MKTIIIVLVLMVSGCAKIRYGDIEYTRWFNQEIGEAQVIITDPNGKTINLHIKGQKSEFELGFEAAGLGLKVGAK